MKSIQRLMLIFECGSIYKNHWDRITILRNIRIKFKFVYLSIIRNKNKG
jgi:hypothetical protein